MKLLVSLFTLLSICSANVGRCAIVSNWTFETSAPTTGGPHMAEAGAMAATSFASSNSGGTFSNPAGNGSPESFSSNGWDAGEYYQFTTNTLGFQGVTISYAQAASNTGPGNFQFQYSSDGVSYTDFGSVYAGPTADFNGGVSNPANVLSVDLSAISALDNKALVGFRIAVFGTTSENGGTIASTGTFRVDDFVVNASAVPEPTALGLLALLGLPLAMGRMRKV